MRTSLHKTIAERRHARRRRSRPAAPSGRGAAEPPVAARSAVQRTRDAGGPMDQASYGCQCGYVFLAEVSTTVTCPHCHAGQTW